MPRFLWWFIIHFNSNDTPFGSEITNFVDLFFISKNIGHFMTCRMLTDKNFKIHLLLWCMQGWCLLVAYFAWLAYLSHVILMTTTIGSNFLLYVYGWAQNLMENSSDASCFLGYIWEVHESSWCLLLKTYCSISKNHSKLLMKSRFRPCIILQDSNMALRSRNAHFSV